MPKLRVAISTPVDNNLYSLLVTQLCIREPRVKIVGVVTLTILSLKRIISEFKRLGISLIRKVLSKYGLCKSKIFSEEEKNLSDSLVKKVNLKIRSLMNLCYKNEIPFIKCNDLNDDKTLNFLKKQRPDIILSIGSQIVNESFLRIPSIGILNVHMGILPEYRGIGVTEWPIIEDRLEDVGLGITLHFMERGVDTGPIIMKKKFPIKKGMFIKNIELNYLPEMVDFMISGVRMARDAILESTPQKKQDGRQYFAIHKRMKIIVNEKLANYK